VCNSLYGSERDTAWENGVARERESESEECDRQRGRLVR
jgi:hypothetical protein